MSLALVLPVAIGLAAILLFLGRLALRAQRQPPATGAEGLVGEHGRARTPVTPDTPGHVDVHGEIWRATSREPLAPGQPVRVVEVHGLTVLVEPLPGSTIEGASAWKA